MVFLFFSHMSPQTTHLFQKTITESGLNQFASFATVLKTNCLGPHIRGPVFLDSCVFHIATSA